MKDAIVTKLDKHLAGSVETECQVVYLLCEVRKLLDKQPPDPNQFALRMFCHWALHVDLTHRATTMPFLERVDSYIFDKLNTGETKETILKEHAMFEEFVYLETFKKQLSEFLKTHALSASLCDEDKRWYSFLGAYGGVIEDGSLTCRTQPNTLKIVEKVTFSKGSRKRPDGHVPFDMKWDIALQDKRRFEVEVGTRANHKLLHWGLRLINP